MKLYNHQIETFDFGLRIGSYADLSEMGTGKTLSTLTNFAYRYKKDPNFTALVVAPKSIIMSGWVADCQDVYPHMKIQPVLGSSEKKLEAWNNKAVIYVTNYETFHLKWDLSDLNLNALVCDEAVKLKNYKARWTETLKKLSREIETIIILSGLITPNNLLEIFSPFDIVIKDVLGKSFFNFKGKYFTLDPFSRSGFTPQKGAEEKITKILKPYIIRHTKAECLDLPDKIHTIREVEMVKKQAHHYAEMEANAMVELEDTEISAVHKAGMLSKLAQISSGFIYDEKKNIHGFESGKINELDLILNGELTGEQVLVFLNFKGEVEYFKKHYKDASFITGGQKTSDQEQNIKDFKSGKNRICFANISASKYGLTLTNTSNVVYYSLNYSLDDFAQSQDRIHRIGQTRTCNYIYLLSRANGVSVDHKIYEALMDKKTLNDLIISMIEKGEI